MSYNSYWILEMSDGSVRREFGVAKTTNNGLLALIQCNDATGEVLHKKWFSLAHVVSFREDPQDKK